MWLINGFVAFFLSTLTYFGLRCLFGDIIDLSVESVNSIILFAFLFFAFFKGADTLTKGF